MCSTYICVIGIARGKDTVGRHYSTHTRVHTRTHTYTRVHTRTHIYTHPYTRIHTHINTHVHTYTHTHIHTNTHIHTHTYSVRVRRTRVQCTSYTRTTSTPIVVQSSIGSISIYRTTVHTSRTHGIRRRPSLPARIL